MPMLTREQLYTATGYPRSTGLISELAGGAKEDVCFTIRETHDVYPSLQKLYIDLTVGDPTEVAFAETVFGSVEFWLNLRGRIEDHVEKWQNIAAMKRKQKAFEAIIAEVDTQGKNAFGAAKYLVEEPWLTKGTPRAQTKEAKEDRRKARANARKTAAAAFKAGGFKDDVSRLKESGLLGKATGSTAAGSKRK